MAVVKSLAWTDLGTWPLGGAALAIMVIATVSINKPGAYQLRCDIHQNQDGGTIVDD